MVSQPLRQVPVEGIGEFFQQGVVSEEVSLLSLYSLLEFQDLFELVAGIGQLRLVDFLEEQRNVADFVLPVERLCEFPFLLCARCLAASGG